MNNPEAASKVQIGLGIASAVGGPAVAVVAALHEAHDKVGMPSSLPSVEHLPGVEHSSSVGASWGIAAVTSVAAEAVAARLENRGREVAAQRVRRAGTIIAWTGSIAAQAMIEGGMRGVGDKWDVVAGVAATAPGILTGKNFVKGVREWPRKGRSTERTEEIQTQ